MKIAIIGPNVENIELAKIILDRLESEGVDISDIKEGYIEIPDGSELSQNEMLFMLKNIGKDYTEKLEAIEKFDKFKDRTYSTKFKDTGAKYGKHNKSRGKM